MTDLTIDRPSLALLRPAGRDLAAAPPPLPGLTVPAPGTVARAATVLVAWHGPRELLLVGATGTGGAEVNPAWRSTDVSAAFVRFRLTGTGIDDIFAAGCALDPRPLTGEWTVRTRFAEVAATLIGSEGRLDVIVAAALRRYLTAWFAEVVGLSPA